MANLRHEEAEPDFEEQTRLLRQAREDLTNFFGHKSYFCGGSIPEVLLFSKESIEFVLDTDFIFGIHYAQDFLIPQIPQPSDFDAQIEWDVHVVLELIHETIKAKIPISAQAAMVILDFKFCRGCSHVTRKEYLDWLRDVSIAA